MLLEKINIEKELLKEKDRSDSLLNEVNGILDTAEKKEQEILSRLEGNTLNLQEIELDQVDSTKVFSTRDIKSICIRYRLRFLDTRYYKAEFPYEAIQKINAFEKKYRVRVEGFKIVAPDSVFELEDVNKDPLLFAQVSANRYFLLHKWGNDLAWYRSIMSFPLRNIYSYFLSVIFLAAFVAFSIPGSWMHMEDPDAVLRLKLWLTVHCFIALFFFIIFLGSLTATNFSEVSWRSKYFNS
jgi:hypothetical protein